MALMARCHFLMNLTEAEVRSVLRERKKLAILPPFASPLAPLLDLQEPLAPDGTDTPTSILTPHIWQALMLRMRQWVDPIDESIADAAMRLDQMWVPCVRIALDVGNLMAQSVEWGRLLGDAAFCASVPPASSAPSIITITFTSRYLSVNSHQCAMPSTFTLLDDLLARLTIWSVCVKYFTLPLDHAHLPQTSAIQNVRSYETYYYGSTMPQAEAFANTSPHAT